MKKRIEFADETWNPVWGCLNNCPYCFARPIAKRFSKQMFQKEFNYRIKESHNVEYCGDLLAERLQDFTPEILWSQLEKKFKKRSTHIFVNSMSDIMYWKPKWWKLVLSHILGYPEKKFIFFTKSKSLIDFNFLSNLPNAVLIKTINTEKDIDDCNIYFDGKLGFCIEPMQSCLSSYTGMFGACDWVIIGAETGNRKNKIEVKPEWIEPFYDLKIPVFMKESIRHLVPSEKFRQERI
jgi:protein gp37